MVFSIVLYYLTSSFFSIGYYLTTLPINVKISQPPPVSQTDVKKSNAPLAVWEDDILLDRSLSIEKNKIIIKEVINPMLKEGQEVLRVGFKLANLLPVELITRSNEHFLLRGSHPSPPTYSQAAVILGENPNFVKLPDETLFKHFMKNVRKGPKGKMLFVFEPSIWYETPEEFYRDYTEQDNRYLLIKIALLLGLGEDIEPLGRWPEYDPSLEATWAEKRGTLTIRYFRGTLVHNKGLWCYTSRYQCEIIVNRKQDYVHECKAVSENPCPT